MKFGNSGKILSFTTPKRRTQARLPCFSLLHRTLSPTLLVWLALGMESTVPRSPSWRPWVGDNNPATSCHYLNCEECRGWRTLASQIRATCLHKTKTKPTWTRGGEGCVAQGVASLLWTSLFIGKRKGVNFRSLQDSVLSYIHSILRSSSPISGYKLGSL